ncbi:Ribokinase-like protein [Annulohypoxylon moriforme]|nr:Ribokinase-like protein [Annulohypoxylon moriforme]
MAPCITVLGSLNIDLVSYVPHHPVPGETITSRLFTVSPGGKGANQAVACAKLSRNSDLSSAAVDISFVGAVGSDTYGTDLLNSLRSYGVKVESVAVRKDQRTGIAIIVVDETDGQNRIILSPESNYSVQRADFESALGQKPDLLIMQLEIPLETVIQALRTATASKIPVLLNPAPAQTLPLEVYQNLSHIIVNESEAALLTNYSDSEFENSSGLDRAVEFFIDKSVQNVVITLGGRGVYFATHTGRRALIPAIKSTMVVDTTAAGDTFVGSYALSIVTKGDHFDIETAVGTANRAAAKTVAKKGAQISIPWRSDLE